MTLVEEIAAERDRRGLSNAELGRMAGMERSHVSASLSGRRAPQSPTLDKLKDALEMTLKPRHLNDET